MYIYTHHTKKFHFSRFRPKEKLQNRYYGIIRNKLELLEFTPTCFMIDISLSSRSTIWPDYEKVVFHNLDRNNYNTLFKI